MTVATLGFGVSLLGVRMVVAGDSETTVAELDRFVLPWLARTSIDATLADRRVDVRGTSDGLEIIVDDVVVDSVPSVRAAIPTVQRALDEVIVQRQTSVAIVHGGVVAHGGDAILLPGPSGAGKSTIVAALLRQGASYLSDEYALLDGDGRAHPYPRPLLLRDGTRTGRPVLARDLGAEVAREPLPVRLIVGLRWSEDRTLELEPSSQGDGVLFLLRNTPQVLAEQPWILTPLRRAVECATCYTGWRGDAGTAAAEILRLAAVGGCSSP